MTEINFEKVSCCICGIIFGIEESFIKSLKEDHKDFYCPNGHKFSYIKK